MDDPARSVVVRPATSADQDSLIGLYADFFAEDGIDVPRGRIAANLAKMLADPRAMILVADGADGIVGLASASTTYGVEFGCAAEFEDLYVIPTCRGQGLSHALVDAMIVWADSQNAEVMALVITAQAERDQTLTRFYSRHGFEVTDRITMYRART